MQTMSNRLWLVVLAAMIIAILIVAITTTATNATNATNAGRGASISRSFPGVEDPIGYSYPAARTALDLLRNHESRNGTRMVGDNGKARGWLHQHESNWNEGCRYLGVNWKWPEDTDDLEKCEHVALAYWCLYSAKYLDNTEELIRRHRLPFAPYREDNNKYLERVLRRR